MASQAPVEASDASVPATTDLGTEELVKVTMEVVNRERMRGHQVIEARPCIIV